MICLTPQGSTQGHEAQLLPGNGCQEIGEQSVVPEGLADVGVQINIAGTEDKASAELKGVPAQAMLAVSRRTGFVACDRIVAAQKMDKGCAS